MNIQRIAKQFAASATSQVIIFGQQILLPPIFIHRYGVASYGEWLALSAAVAYLGTLNFGMQTYVNNELTMRYSRGEMAEYQVMQSTALRMLLGVALTAAALMSAVFFLPAQRWLHLSLGHQVVSIAIFFLGLQVLATLPMNYFAGTFMVFGKAHRGTHWQNISRTMMVLTAIAMAWFHASFAAIAIGQFLMVVLYSALMLVDLRRLAPDIFPTLRYWDTAMSRAILGPSGYFFLIYSCNFLVYQLPVILIQRTLGPVVVVMFNVMRTIFSTMRQGLGVFTTSLGPEITNLYGRGEWASLKNLYSLSEKVLFALIPPLNVTALLLAPVLLRVWLHKPYLYSLTTYGIMAMVSCALSVKDHKFQFQISTNHHSWMARVSFVSYLIMVIISMLALRQFGLAGFLVVWLITEASQATYVLWLNARLLAPAGPVEKLPAIKMLALLPVGLAAAIILELHIRYNTTYLAQGAIAIAFGLALFGISAWVFHLKDVLHRFMARRARAQAAMAG